MPASFTWTLLTPPTPAAATVDPSADNGGNKVRRDLKIDFVNRRLVVKEGSFVYVTGAEAIMQDVWLALGFFEGEWFLDLTKGFPYFRLVLVKNPNIDLIQAAYRDTILSRKGVKSLLALTLDFNRTQRSLAVSFRISTDVGVLASTGVAFLRAA